MFLLIGLSKRKIHFSEEFRLRSESQHVRTYAPSVPGLLSSEHVVSGGPAINGRSQSGRTLKRPPEYRSGLQPASALRLAIDRQEMGTRACLSRYTYPCQPLSPP
jgi:hypothetical protein